MTRRTVVADFKMCRRFARGSTSIMAGEAGAQRAHMVKVNNRPTDWDVTIFTGICRWQMTAGLARGARAVVTATAIIDYSRMIKDTNGPGQCNVAGGAIIA